MWGWSIMTLIGEGHNFMTSMNRFSQDNVWLQKFTEIYQIITKLCF